jgi:hypothetical protein
MTDLLDYALCSSADVKESLNIAAGDTSKDNLIKRKINQATRMIEGYCGCRFKLTQYTNEEYNASNTNQLVLRNAPVVKDDTHPFTFDVRNSVLNDDSWQSLPSEFQFVDQAAGILDLGFTAVGQWAHYRVSYYAGYSTIPEDVAEACATLAAYLVQNPTGTGTQVRLKQEGQRRLEYFDNQGRSLIEQLGLDDVLAPYVINFVGTA